MGREDEIVLSITNLTKMVEKGFADGEKRMDKQDIIISDIQDQIKGNVDKDIYGLKNRVKEIRKVLVIPMFIYKLPMWAKWLLAAITVNGVADINSMGLIAFLKWIIHTFKP